MKCYMSRPKILHRNPSGQTCWKNPTAVHNFRSPNKKHLKLNWSFQTLQTCLKNNTSTLVQNMIPNYMLFQVGSHRLFPIVSFRLPKWCFPLIRNGFYRVLPWLQAAHRPGCRTSRWLQLRSTRPTQPAIKRCSRKKHDSFPSLMWKVKVKVHIVEEWN